MKRARVDGEDVAHPVLGLVVLDLAGTCCDHGSRAPANAFVELFSAHDVAITEAQAREPVSECEV